MNGDARHDVAVEDLARQLRLIWAQRREMNALRYRIDKAERLRRLAGKARQAAEAASQAFEELSFDVERNEAVVRSANARIDAAIGERDELPGSHLAVAGFAWKSTLRRRVEALIAARDRAVEQLDAASEAHRLAVVELAELHEDVAFLEALAREAAEGLPASDRSTGTDSLRIGLVQAIRLLPDDEVWRALHLGLLTEAQFRELMTLADRDRMVAALDAGDWPEPEIEPGSDERVAEPQQGDAVS